MLLLFQTLSNDGQYSVMWSAFQAEPDYSWLTFLYFVGIGILMGQVLLNVFVAVLANVLAHFRAVFDEAISERLGPPDGEQTGQGSSTVNSPSAVNSPNASTVNVLANVDSPSGSKSSLNVFTEKGLDENVGQEGMGEEENEPTDAEDKESSEPEVEKEEKTAILTDDLSPMTVVASRVFRSDFYNAFVMLMIFSNCMSLALIGRYVCA